MVKEELGLKEFQKLAGRTDVDLGYGTVNVGNKSWVIDFNLHHYIHGINSELFAEFTQAIEKGDTVNAAEELGDTEWFIVRLAKRLGITLKDSYGDYDKERDWYLAVTYSAGTLSDIVKGNLAYGKKLPTKAVFKELIEDILSSVHSLSDNLGIDPRVTRVRTIRKLYKRYPEKFSITNALIRNLAAERHVLEGGK